MRERKVNVAVIMAWYAPYRVPLLREVARKRDIDLTVIYCSPFEEGREWRLSSGLPFSAIFLKPKRLIELEYKHYFGQSFQIDYPNGLVTTLTRLKPHVVIAYEYHLECMISAAYAAMSRAAYVTWSDVTELHDFRMGGIRTITRKLLLSRSRALIGSSSDTLDHLCRNFGFPRSRAFLSILCSHWEDFVPAAAKTPRAPEHAEDIFRLLYVGSLIPRKGLDILIEAFASFTRSFERCRLTLIGSGPEKENLVRLTRQLGCDAKVEFKDHVPYQGLAAEMAGHDVFVLPSRLDVFGLVVGEAMACGLPVICSRNAGAANDLVKDNGIVVDAENVEDMAAAFKVLANDPKLRGRMSACARSVLQLHSLQSAVDGFVKAIHSAQQSLTV